MSDRRTPILDEALAQWMRDIEDRLRRAEQGAMFAGHVSFGPSIQIGDIQVTILKAVGTHRTIEFKNLLSGATSTIVL